MENDIHCKQPDCITTDKEHVLELCYEKPFYMQCACCFERYALISETALKAMEIEIIPNDNGSHGRLKQ